MKRKMKDLLAKASRHRYIIAAGVILIGIGLTLILRHYAYLERGFRAIGGEYMPLALFSIIALIVLDALKKCEMD